MAGTRALGASLLIALLSTAPAAADWEAPQRVDNAGAQFLEFVDGDIGTGSNGLTTALFWQRTQTSGDSGQLFAARRTADGAWGAPVATPSQTTATPTFTDAVSAPDGSAHAAFTFDRTLRTIDWLAAADAPGAIVDTGVIAEGANGNAPNAPDVAVDAAGNVYAVSVRRASGYRAVVFTFDAASGTWSETPLVASGTAGAVYNPRIAANASGDLAVSWAINRDDADRVYAARKLAAEAEFQTPNRQISETESGNFAEDVHQHDVAIDAEGNITVAYAQDAGRFSPVQGQPQSYDRIAVLRWPAGSAAPDPATRTVLSDPDPMAGSTYDPQVAVSGQGRVFVAWQQLADPVAPRAQTNDEIFLAEYTGEWGAPGQVTGADAPSYDIAVDSAGFLTVAWTEGEQAKARRKPPGEDFEDEAVISLAGAEAGAVDVGFAPHLSDTHGTQTDVIFKQTLTATTRNQALAARFVPGVAPGPEPEPVPPLSNCPPDNALQTGDDGDNTLTGTPVADTLLGLGGVDRLIGLGGVDCLRGGDGNDTAAGGEAGDDVEGGAGDDTVEGNEGNDSVGGGEGDDLVAGQDGLDGLEGNTGNDRVLGGSGNDAILGGDGDDRLFGQAFSDLISGDAGNDLVSGGDGNDLMAGGIGNDRMLGGRQNDTMLGGEGDDKLNGGPGRDNLFGEDGSDILRGRAGRDLLVSGPGTGFLFGGAGRDRLIGDALGEVLKGGRERDRIIGDAGDDRLRGGGGRDQLDAGDGDDVIKARDGRRDRINCGSGSDRVSADRRDRVHFSCEFVRARRSAPAAE